MVIQNPEAVASLSADRVINKFSDELKNMASDAGWPQEIVSSMALTYQDGAVQISYPKQYESQVMNLEFGKEGAPPNSVIRTFMLRYQNEAGKELTAAVADDIWNYGGIL